MVKGVVRRSEILVRLVNEKYIKNPKRDKTNTQKETNKNINKNEKGQLEGTSCADNIARSFNEILNVIKKVTLSRIEGNF